MPKKNNKSKSPIKILATIGFVIAILWTAKGFFQFGSAGYKEVKNKISKTNSNLPTLKCIASDGSDTIIYDLAEIEANEPKNIPEELKARERFFQQDGYFELITVTDKEYHINFHNVENGMRKGYTATITRSSGVVQWTFPGKYRADLSFGDLITVMQNAKRFSGVCSKIEKKNL
tara:strand:+ start:161 stop:685 length:525 start_codon:yes stop_codon:yes gene_type:complete